MVTCHINLQLRRSRCVQIFFKHCWAGALCSLSWQYIQLAIETVLSGTRMGPTYITRILFALMHMSCGVLTLSYHFAWRKYSAPSPDRPIVNVCGVDRGSKCRVCGSCVANSLTLHPSHSLLHELMERKRWTIPRNGGITQKSKTHFLHARCLVTDDVNACNRNVEGPNMHTSDDPAQGGRGALEKKSSSPTWKGYRYRMRSTG